MFIAALFTIAKTWKQPKCPLTDDQIRKMWYIYTVEYYSAIQKNEIMPFAAPWMELKTLIVSEGSQKEKDKCHMISLIIREMQNVTTTRYHLTQVGMTIINMSTDNK